MGGFYVDLNGKYVGAVKLKVESGLGLAE